MRDERAKYLIVDANNITKQLYECERVAACNDFYNFYHRTEKISANDIFEKNNVPEDYRRIIIKVSKPLFSKTEAEEYTMGYPFDFKDKSIQKVNNEKYIKMHNMPIYYYDNLFNDKIVFKSEEFYVSFNNVMYLLEKMYKEGCLENYLQSIKEFFDISLDLGLLFEAWHQTNNTNKTLKLYKQKVASKRI